MKQEINMKIRVAMLLVNSLLCCILQVYIELNNQRLLGIDHSKVFSISKAVVLGLILVVYVLSNQSQFLLAKVNVLQSLFELKVQKTKYQTILQNLDQAVMSCTELGIQYFNNHGEKILETCIQHVDEDARALCQEGLGRLKDQINGDKMIVEEDELSKKFQAEILS